jgi:hypothetical protein
MHELSTDKFRIIPYGCLVVSCNLICMNVGDKVAASPKILFTGMRYKQGEKVMSGLSAYPCVCRVCVPACLPVCLSV